MKTRQAYISNPVQNNFKNKVNKVPNNISTDKENMPARHANKIDQN